MGQEHAGGGDGSALYRVQWRSLWGEWGFSKILKWGNESCGHQEEEHSRQRKQRVQRPWGGAWPMCLGNSKEPLWLEQRGRGEEGRESGRSHGAPSKHKTWAFIQSDTEPLEDWAEAYQELLVKYKAGVEATAPSRWGVVDIFWRQTWRDLLKGQMWVWAKESRKILDF